MRLCLLGLLCSLASAQNSPAGIWSSNLKDFDSDYFTRLQLKLSGTTLTGTLGEFAFEGTFENGHIEGKVQPGRRTTILLTGTLFADRIEGTGTIVGEKLVYKWEATRETVKKSPRTHTFEPARFQHFFSDAIEPVLRISPGDTVKTWSVDAGGADQHGIRLTSGGNPLTGPFYIEGAVPGDTLVVHFNRIRLNRDTAISSAGIDDRALTPAYIEQRKGVQDYNSDWKLDREAGYASLAKPTDAMKDYKVPLVPMLGCVGVAPAGGMRQRSAFLGSYGGNLDYNQLREGVTLYLPVYVPGALLFVGDGHAAQGAGELTGNALETSMDIEFTADIQSGGAPDFPRLEAGEFIMASGIGDSIDGAFRAATTNMVRWLEQMYGLNAAEISSVLGTSMVYDIAEVVDPSPHVVAKVPKSALAGLKKAPRP